MAASRLASHSINDGVKARITVIVRVMDVCLRCHSVTRKMFSGCLSDLGLGLGGLYLENVYLGSSDEIGFYGCSV